MPGQDGDDEVAVDQGAVASTASTRSPSPSKARPRSKPSARTSSLQALDVGRAAAVVDVQAVGLRVERHDVGARFGQGERRA